MHPRLETLIHLEDFKRRTPLGHLREMVRAVKDIHDTKERLRAVEDIFQSGLLTHKTTYETGFTHYSISSDRIFDQSVLPLMNSFQGDDEAVLALDRMYQYLCVNTDRRVDEPFQHDAINVCRRLSNAKAEELLFEYLQNSKNGLTLLRRGTALISPARQVEFVMMALKKPDVQTAMDTAEHNYDFPLGRYFQGGLNLGVRRQMIKEVMETMAPEPVDRDAFLKLAKGMLLDAPLGKRATPENWLILFAGMAIANQVTDRYSYGALVVVTEDDPPSVIFNERSASTHYEVSDFVKWLRGKDVEDYYALHVARCATQAFMTVAEDKKTPASLREWAKESAELLEPVLEDFRLARQKRRPTG